MTILFESDFEDPSFTEWDAHGNYVTESLYKIHGVYGAKDTSALGILMKTWISKVNIVYARIFMRFENIVAGVGGTLFLYDSTGVGNNIILDLVDSGVDTVFRLRNTLLGSDSGTTPIQNDTWYCVELRGEISATASLKLYLNGVEECSLAGDTSTQGTGIDTIEIDSDGYGFKWDQMYLDYLMVSDVGPIGCEIDYIEPSVPVYRKWRVYINNVEYTYSSIDFEETHPSQFPDTCTIVLNGQHNINSFSVIEIERDGVLKFYGYVEKPKWTSDVDTIIIGRCRKLVVWKKWTERFTEARGEMQGFFGITHPEEIFKFIVRCPVSDMPDESELWKEYPHQKIGWGMNSDAWTCSANSSSNGTDPIYAKLRLLDFYWRNRGDDSVMAALVPNATAGSHDWGDVGGAGVACVNDCSNDAAYITEIDNGQHTWDYGFTNLAATATGINNVTCRLRLQKLGGWFGWAVTVLVEVYDGTNWSILGYVTFNNTNWGYASLDATKILDTVTKVNAAQIRLTKYAGPPSMVMCSCITLRVDYSANGSQEIGDYYQIHLGSERERVCGVIVQSRHSADSYPRNYCVQKYTDGYGDEDFTTYTEVDIPANRITIVSATHIDHEQHRDETTYTYDDKGLNQITSFEHGFRFRVITDPIPSDADPKIYTPWMTSDTLGDAFAQMVAFAKYCMFYVYNSGAGAVFAVRITGVATFEDIGTSVCAPNTWYWVRIIKNGMTITAYVYTTEADYDGDTNRYETLTTTMTVGTDFAMRYLYAGVTYNDALDLTCDGDIEIFNIGDWENLVCVTNESCAQDIIHSWTPQPIEIIRIIITVQDASHAWEISQIYIYECDDAKYRVCEE